jgi:hypothetical protein
MMDEATPSPKEADAGARFTVDLGEIELTDEEVSTLQHQITNLAVETARKKGSGSTHGPFIKIIFVRAVHP